MYASFTNQLVHLSYYMLSFTLLFILWPRLLFSRNGSSLNDNLVSGFMKMTLLLISLGYFLVIVKLFEVLSLGAILFILSVRKHLQKKQAATVYDIIDELNILLYDVTDGIIHPFRLMKSKIGMLGKKVKTHIVKHLGSLGAFTDTLFFIFVFLYSIYLRLYDAVTHAAPALSDAYTTLEWMKHIDSRILFYADGGEVYPRGFHITLANINKFAVMDPLYVLRYSGPFVCILIVFGLYFAVKRMSGRQLPAIIAVMVYGVLGSYLPMEWERQASTNSQEFALVFVLPVLFFFFRYIRESKPEDFKVAAMGIIVIGLVHQMALAFAGIGIGVLIFLSLFTGVRENFKKLVNICIASIASVIIAVIPLGIGKIMGIGTLSTSAEFLFDKVSVDFPALSTLSYVDRIGLLFIAIMLLYSIIMRLFTKKPADLFAFVYMALLGLAAFALYFYGAWLTQSILIQARSGEFWALMLPCCIGLGWHALSRILPALSYKGIAEKVIFMIILVYTLTVLKPTPILPYKIHSDVYIEQYFNITKQYRPKTWWLVSSNIYWDNGIVNGSGFYVQALDFIKAYDPEGKPLTKFGATDPGKELPDDVFIFMEKEIFKVEETNSVYPIMKLQYEQRERDDDELAKWMSQRIKSHTDVKIFYESEALMVYHIHIPKEQDEIFKKIWEDQTKMNKTGGAV